MIESLLEVKNLRKSFGALVATDGVDFDVREGETHAVIGPNGAGKTTFIKQLSGELRPDAGSVRFADEDITGLPAQRRSRKGLARSFQITSIYREFSALDNVALAVQAHAGHSFRFWKAAREDRLLTGPALQILESIGLHERKNVLPRSFPTASSASSRSPWRSPPGRACCCSTSRWPAWAPTNLCAW